MAGQIRNGAVTPLEESVITTHTTLGHNPLHRYTRTACRVGLALAAVATATIVVAGQPPSSDTPPFAPLVWPQPISQVDVHAATLRGQPNMHGIGVMIGPDGHPRMFCVDPSEANQPALLRLELQSGADTVRYK